MDPRIYLKQIRTLKRAIEIKEARYKEYEMKSNSVSSPIYGVKIDKILTPIMKHHLCIGSK